MYPVLLPRKSWFVALLAYCAHLCNQSQRWRSSKWAAAIVDERATLPLNKESRRRYEVMKCASPHNICPRSWHQANRKKGADILFEIDELDSLHRSQYQSTSTQKPVACKLNTFCDHDHLGISECIVTIRVKWMRITNYFRKYSINDKLFALPSSVMLAVFAPYSLHALYLCYFQVLLWALHINAVANVRSRIHYN